MCMRRLKRWAAITTPSSPAGISSESFFTSSPARPKIACSSFSFRRQFALGLRSDLADQDGSRPDASADANHAVLIEIGEGTFRHVRNVASEFLTAELRFANFDIIFLDVNRGEDVFLHETLVDNDGVFEVVAVEGLKRDEHVAAEGEFALVYRSAVGQDLALLDALTLLDDRLLVLARAFVQSHELSEFVFIGVVDEDALEST